MKLTINILVLLASAICNFLLAKPNNDLLPNKRENFQQSSLQRIRLGHEGAEGFHRQLLLGFTDLATEGVDAGFDAKMLDVFTTDGYWFLDNTPYTIQGLPFNLNLLVDIGVISAFEQTHTFMIDALENYTGEVWLVDTESGQMFDLKAGSASFLVPAGTFNNRFKLAFTNTTLSLLNLQKKEPTFRAFYLKSTASVWIESQGNPPVSVEIFDRTGRKIDLVEVNSPTHIFKLPFNKYPVGIYLLIIKTRDKFFKNKILKF